MNRLAVIGVGLIGGSFALALKKAKAVSHVVGVGRNQANLDVAYQDFLRQQGYPQSQIDAMLGTFKGVGQGIPTAGLEQGIVPSGVPAQYKPSTASQIGAGLAGLGGLAGTLADLGIF